MTGGRVVKRSMVGPAVAWLVAVVCFIVAVGLTVGWWPHTDADPSPEGLMVADLDGRAVQLEAPVTADAARDMNLQVPDETAPRLVIPDSGLDVGVGEVSTVGGEVNPPDFQHAFRIRDFGVPVDSADQGAVFLVMHSVQGGRAPGNYVVDPDTLEPRLVPGDTVLLGRRPYKVTAVREVAKPDLATDPIWQSMKGDLVIVTCLQRESGPSLSNLVIEARTSAVSERSAR